MRSAYGVAATPFTKGPYRIDQHVTFEAGMTGTMVGKAGKIYYVDEENGNNNNDGLTPSTAKATILGATALCRDDYSDDAEYHVFIFPGSYDETEDLRLYGHGIHLHGMGIPGSDSGVNITDTNVTYAPILLAGANCTIENIYFIQTSASNSTYGAIYAIAADNCMIRNCTFKNSSGTGTNAILIDDMRKSTITGCTFGDAGTSFTNNIHAETGADKYLINSRIEDNQIYSDNAAAKGIYIHADCLCYGTVITRNYINLGKATGASVGIDNDNTNVCLIADNFVVMASGDTPIESASSPTGIVGNHTLAGTTTVDPNEAAD